MTGATATCLELKTVIARLVDLGGLGCFLTIVAGRVDDQRDPVQAVGPVGQAGAGAAAAAGGQGAAALPEKRLGRRIAENVGLLGGRSLPPLGGRVRVGLLGV